MATAKVHCYIPLLGEMLRVTELDSCGAVPTDGNMLVTDSFTSITLSAEVEEGTEIIKRKANGALCVNEKQADSFKRFTVEIDFCNVNPALLGMTTNAKPYLDAAGDVIGFTVPEGAIKKWFALELWTGMSGVSCAPGAGYQGGYMLLPMVTAGVLGDIEIGGEDAIDFSLSGGATKGGNAWGHGRYNVVRDAAGNPAPLPTALDPFDHLLMIDTALAPPDPSCDPAPVPHPAVTGVTAGAPGSLVPANAAPPATLAALTADPVIGATGSAKPTDAWTTGQYIVLGDGSEAHWTGTAWASGKA